MKYIIDGSFLYGHIKGVQRYARQITKELDKYMADKPYEVEIAVPEIDSEGTSAEINSYKTHYNNIKIVILAGKSGRMWEQFTFQRYVDKQKAKPSVFAVQFGYDEDVAAAMVVLTTFISIITLPAVALIITTLI